MRYYLTNKDGLTVERNLTRNQLQNVIERGKFRMATLNERRAFLHKQRAEEEAFLNDPNFINIYYEAPTHNPDGYGNSSRQFKERAKKYGFYFNRIQKDQKIGFCYSIANEIGLMKTPIKIGMTMFESSKLPDFWKPFLESADELIVPAQFCQDIFKANYGLEPKIIRLGIEPDNFYYQERNRTEEHKFTFLHLDAFKWRKGWDLVFNAFNEEFGEDGGDDVRLIFKTTLDITPPLHYYKKISVIKGRLPQEELLEIYQNADCFVFPTRGEGFGLTPLEAMATGMPAIVPNHTGISEYWHDAYCYDLQTREVRAKYDNLELRGMYLGTQLEPTVESLREQMRKAYNEWKTQTGKYAVGVDKQMAEYARTFNIEDTVKQICEILRKYV